MFFRYPGGKSRSKLPVQIVAKLREVAIEYDLEYIEPFLGGFGIGIKLLQETLEIDRIWINDFDPGISCLWTTVINYPDLLKEKILAFKPSVPIFYELKKFLLASPPDLTLDEQIADYGFKKLAIHQISYSGLGTKSGGPQGGDEQYTEYPIDCRWNPVSICKKIDSLHELLSDSALKIRYGKCTNLDFAELISGTKCDAIIYLDPPYFVKGNTLYQHGFTKADHIRLAEALRKTKHLWALSYDDCEEIRKLYNWADIALIDGINYSITALKDKTTGKRTSRSKSELLITSRNFQC